jgi:hypothetical protein
MVPRILVVVRIPDKLADWSEASEDHLLLRHCGYWLSLRGAPDIDNTESKTVHLSRSQLFTVKNLHSLMNRIATGEMP